MTRMNGYFEPINYVDSAAIDLGYNVTKFVSFINDQKFKAKFRSIARRKLGYMVSGMESDSGYALDFDGISWDVGNEGRYNLNQKRFEDPADYAKLLAAFGVFQQKVGKYKLDINTVVTGLPVIEFEKGKNRLKNLMTRDFEYGFQGESYKVTFRNVEVIPQSAGAFYSYILDDDGEPRSDLNIDIQNQKVVVIDIGGKSSDIVVFNREKFVQPPLSFTFYTGVDTVNRALTDLMVKEFNLVDAPVNTITRALEEKKLQLGRIDEDITELVDEAINYTFDDIYGILTSRLGDLRQYQTFLLAGGGAYVYHDLLKKIIPDQCNVILLPEAEYANADGYNKFAKLIG